MITYFGEWIRHIVLLIFIATFIDLLLPNSGMRRYVKLVVGLLIIMIILTPVLHLIQFDYERLLFTEEEWAGDQHAGFTKRIDAGQTRLEHWQNTAILDEVESAWSEELKAGIVEKFGLDVPAVELELAIQRDEIVVEQLTLVLQQRDVQEMDFHTAKSSLQVESIRPVSIEIMPLKQRVAVDEQVSPEKKIEQEILTYLSEEWNISVDKVTCTWIRR